MSDHIDVQHARDNLRHMKEEERQRAQEFWERTQAAGRAIQQTTDNLRNRRRLRNRASRGREQEEMFGYVFSARGGYGYASAWLTHTAWRWERSAHRGIQRLRHGRLCRLALRPPDRLTGPLFVVCGVSIVPSLTCRYSAWTDQALPALP